jgi:hypothetical protein
VHRCAGARRRVADVWEPSLKEIRLVAAVIT